MNKATIFFLLILLAALSLGGTFAYADEDRNEREVKSSAIIEVKNDSGMFEISGEGKSKIQFRIKNNHNDENSEFMIKGVITASTSDSITIDGKVINMDSSVTEKIKIVGKIEVGAYAMAKGEIKDSKYYAEKIVVNQRNKKEIEEINQDNDSNATVSATPTPTIALDDDEDENATPTARLDFGNIINTIQNFLNYLKDLASKI
nr:hypothetical protein [Candidatus Levybacteria bacterium]